MIRLVVPILLVSLISWVLIFGLQGKAKEQTKVSIRHGLIALGIGVGVVFTIIGLFYMGGIIQ